MICYDTELDGITYFRDFPDKVNLVSNHKLEIHTLRASTRLRPAILNAPTRSCVLRPTGFVILVFTCGSRSTSGFLVPVIPVSVKSYQNSLYEPF